MKFREMSWKELEEDFKEFLDNISTEELVESLKEYTINNEKYSFEIPYGNNLNENSLQESVNIIIVDKAFIKEDIIDNKNNIIEIDSQQYLEMEDAA